MTETIENVRTRGNREEPLLSVRDLKVAFGKAQPENPLTVKNFEVAPCSGNVLTSGIAGTFLECTANRVPLLLCRTDCAAV